MQKMSGIENSDEITQSQLEALAGGELLKAEVREREDGGGEGREDRGGERGGEERAEERETRDERRENELE